MKPRRIVIFPLIVLISACASQFAENKLEPKIAVTPTSNHQLKENEKSHKSIFVFLDGTENNQKSSTNVWRLYEMVQKNNDPQIKSIYIPGVGSTDDPLDTKHVGKAEDLLEAALGKGMQQRILLGYEFVAHNYNPGDDIYIFSALVEVLIKHAPLLA